MPRESSGKPRSAPALAERRRHSTMLRVRMLPDHAELINEAAEHAGVSLSDWLRERMLIAARRELRQI